jgi:hypothetical protein
MTLTIMGTATTVCITVWMLAATTLADSMVGKAVSTEVAGITEPAGLLAQLILTVYGFAPRTQRLREPMSITTTEQLEKLRACGMIVAKAFRAMSAAVHPGVTTGELSAIGSRILAENGAQSSPPLIYNFPGDLIAATTGRVSLDRDGGTVRTADGSLSTHYEHTIVITKREPILLTAA